MDSFLKSALAYVINPEARELSEYKYPNGAGMSIREARMNGYHINPKPKAKVEKRRLRSATLLIFACFGFINMANDVITYYDSMDNDGCCAVVPKSPVLRPFTHLMVDNWTSGAWRQGAGTERWFISEGMVNGNPKFWRILDKHSPSISSQQLKEH